jgi:hypothetical protein
VMGNTQGCPLYAGEQHANPTVHALCQLLLSGRGFEYINQRILNSEKMSGARPFSFPFCLGISDTCAHGRINKSTVVMDSANPSPWTGDTALQCAHPSPVATVT